ncbi:MAG TPA: carboxypeptidase regulatory-like domain-containing protein [Gemmatimonadales bacterium]|nr:carboxypeptidase regulatory-like domain-containing protein [Gemmatimonadales bacterium]
MLHSTFAFALSLAATLGVPAWAAAQAVTANLTGRVVNRETRDAVQGARVVLVGTGAAAISDSAGRFRYGGLAPGDHRFEVRAIGYAKGVWLLRLGPGEQQHEFELDVLSYELTGVVVEAHGSLAEFERRRLRGMGFFFTQEEIERRHAVTLSDLIRGVPGVQTTCRQGSCVILMARSTRGCRPEYYLDGFPASFSVGSDFQVQGIYGVEVYRTASEAPVQYRKPELRCGVILLWSRMGP